MELSYIAVVAVDALVVVDAYVDANLFYWDVDPGAELLEHSHPHEQIANVLEGRFELTVDGEPRVLEPGMVAVIPGGLPHSGKALTSCRLLDAFHPAREDYK